MRRTRETMSLQCILTDAEKLQCSKIQNEHIEAKANAEAALKAFSTQKKAEIDAANAMISLQYQKISTGKEYRPVQCDILYNFDTKVKTWTRIDTGEIVKDNIITESELQEEITFQQSEQKKANEAHELAEEIKPE